MLHSGVIVPESKLAATGCAILVINLDRSPDRLAFQRAQAERLGLDFTRIVAVDGMKLSDDIYRLHAFNWQRVLTRNEVACLLSHAKCWQHVIQTGRNSLILEDDAVVSPEIVQFLETASQFNGAVAINLETQGKKSFLRMSGGEGFPRLLTSVSGSLAYLITPEAARVLLNGLPGRAGLADNYIWSHTGVSRLQADPAYCMGMDVMQAYFRLDPFVAASSSIAYRKPSGAEKLRSYLKHPLTALRRIRAEAKLGLAKVILPLVAERRVVAPHPSILANYQALRGVYNG